MPTPQNNPTKNRDTNGRRVRHVRYCAGLRVFRADDDAERTLEFAKQALTGETPADHPSVSMILRRALKIYRRHLDSALHSPLGLKIEHVAIREGTVMPAIGKPKGECNK